MTLPLSKTRFTEFLVRENSLEEYGFEEWLFYPGMLFNEKEKWWGDKKGGRTRPHEGVDLFLYKDQKGRILCLDKNTRVPAMYDGVVVSILDDFLGKSVVMEHDFAKDDSRRFCTIYGHTKPHGGIHVGSVIEEGDIIATPADADKSQADIATHVHVSVGWVLAIVSYDRFDWETIGDPDAMILLDPLNIIERRYV